jgi:hypothetical protein
MVSVWWHDTSAKVGNIKVKLAHRELFFDKTVKDASVETIAKAMKTVDLSITFLGEAKPKIKGAVRKYFKADDGATIRSIIAKLELVKGGFSSGKLVMKTDNSSSERLQSLGVDAGDVQYIEGYVRNASNGGKGQIHVSRDYVMNNRYQAVRTFIHEATHKFANTDDFDEQGYIFADGSDFRQPGITAAQCLNNADSYAYLCMACGYR